MASEDSTSLRTALRPPALKAALVPQRPVFADPWDSSVDMFACIAAVGAIEPLLLWGGGKLMSSIFGFGSHWHLGVFIAASVVGAAGFMTIVGRERTSLAVDVLAIAAWVLLGVVVAPVVGLAPSAGAAVAIYAGLLIVIVAYVLLFGHWKTAFLRTLTWPMTWLSLGAFFGFCAYRLLLYP